MTKLKQRQIKPTRELMHEDQDYKCALCGGSLTADNARLDHDHSSGAIRGVLHDGCNRLLGKIENNHKRFGVQDLPAFLAGVWTYLSLHQHDQTGLIHPTHKTTAEKKAASAAKAKKKRAEKKNKEPNQETKDAMLRGRLLLEQMKERK